MVRVKKGDCAPDFTPQSNKGENISLSQFLGKKNIALFFIRGMKDLPAAKRLQHSELIMKSSKKVIQK